VRKASENRQDAARPREEVVRQMGSLGGGNHFIELCIDESERLW